MMMMMMISLPSRSSSERQELLLFHTYVELLGVKSWDYKSQANGGYEE